MLSRVDHLLVKLAEECAEVAQRATKALSFGLDDVQPGQDLNNTVRLKGEVIDLFAILEMLMHEKVELLPVKMADAELIQAKKRKVEHYLEYSRDRGR